MVNVVTSCAPICSPSVAETIPGVAPDCVDLCGTGLGTGGPDVENLILCDVGPGGEVLGTALAVYEYDTDGNPVGAPTFVDPITALPYVPQGTMQPCNQPNHDVESMVLCDVQPDNSTIEFIRRTTYRTDTGAIISTADQLFDGSVYVATGTVSDCNPYRLCTPLSDVDLNGDCGPGESPDNDIISGEGVSSDSVITDDPTADPLCGGVWDRPSEASPFEVAETFRNATFDQPGPVTQGTAPYAGLTASPGWTGSNVDAPGQGWLQMSDINSFTNGIWQVPDPFNTADGMTARVTFASHDGTITPNGDGMAFVFTDGSVPPQSTPIGGGGNLGLANWQGGYVGIVLDEYGGVTNQANTIAITGVGAHPGAGSIVGLCSPVINLAPHSVSADTGRANPGQLITSIITEGGSTYVSASILWDGDVDPTVYFNRFDVTDCVGVAPSTLRMALYGGSGGAFRSEHEYRDAIATAAGKQEWRAFPIVTDPIPECVTSVRVEVCVDVTIVEDTQTVGNGNPEVFLWMVNSNTGAVLDKAQRSSQPSQVGTSNTMCVDATVPVAQLADLRFYVGAETRDTTGIYGSSWENLQVTVAGLGCPVLPVRTIAISAPCPIDVRVIGGTSDGTPAPVTVVNTPATFEDALVCMTISGESQPGFRREVRGADGNVTVSFLGESGVPVTPDSWVPGECVPEDIIEYDSVILCDPNTGDRVIVVTTYSAAGVPVSNGYDLDGNPYPGALVDLVVCDTGGIESDPIQMCDDGVTPFIRWFVKDAGEPSGIVFDTDMAGAPYATNGPVAVGNCGTAAFAFVEGDEPGCAAGVPWNRRRTGIFDSLTGNLISVVETYVNSGGIQQPIAPAGFQLGACPEIDQYDTAPVSVCYADGGGNVTTFYTYERVQFNNQTAAEVSRVRHWFDGQIDTLVEPTGTFTGSCQGPTIVESEEIGCADGVTWSRRRTAYFDGATGQLITVIYNFVDGDDNQQPTAPANFALGPCCCDQLLGEACWDNGTETGRAFVMYDPTSNSTTYLDQATGDNIPAAQIVTCLADLDPVDTVAGIGRIEEVVAGSIPTGKQSVSFTNVGTAAGSVLGVPLRPGETVQYTAYYDQVLKEMKRLPAIAYVASATAVLHISWVD